AASIRSSGLRSAAAIRAALGKAPTAAAGVQVIFAALARDLERSRFLYGCPIGTPATEAAAVSDQIQAACREVFDAWVAAYRDALVAEGWAEAAADTQALAIVTAYEGSVTIARALRNTAPVVTTGEDLIARIEAGDTKTSEEDR
ncbi:MAG: TetR family transcriptional regulator C-terminal domain-containing protein, partial [Actinomycetota bacterium]